MKNWCYNIIGKRIRESEDIIAACTCPAGSGINCLRKCNHVGTILFVLEDFNGKKLKTFAEPLTCTSQLLKWNVPRDSSTNPSPFDKTLVKKINLETIRTQKLNQKIIVMIHPHQMINILVMTSKSVYLPVDCFYSMTLSPNVQEIVKKKKLNVKLLNL